MAQEARRTTLREVAAAAGVSLGTASNAFNRPELVSTRSRERVLAAARSLGYRGPDPAARHLRTGTSGALGLVFTDRLEYAFGDPAAVIFLRGISEGIRGRGAGLLIVPTTPSRNESRRVVREALVDGFILYSAPDHDPRVEAVIERQLPAVVVDQPRGLPFPFIGIDDREAARTAAAHLRELRHERFLVLAFVDAALSDPRLRYQVTAARLAGYRDGLGEGWAHADVERCRPNSVERGEAVALEALARPERPTAILAMSDALALGARRAAERLGIAVPAELSIVGFDDSPLALLSDPPLTTVSQPTEEKGRLAAEQLLAALEEGSPPPRSETILETRLVVRDSTAPAPAGATA